MSIVTNIQAVVNKMSVANAIDFAIGEREFNNLLTAQREYQIWIDAPLQSNGTINAGSLRRNYQVKMLFVKKQNFGNNYQQHYDNAIDVMRALSKEFILRVNNEVDSVTGARVFDTVQTVRETDIINLFDENLSGILIEFDLRLINDGSICTPNLLPAPTVYIFSDASTVVSGTIIRLGWIAFNVNTIEVSGIGQVSAIGYANVQIDVNTTFTATAENESGTANDSITITVGSACLDATAVLKDTLNNTISTTNIPSGDSEDIIAPDGNITLKKSDNSNLRTVSVRSNQSKNETISDSVAVIKDTANNTLKTENILAETSENITINNTLVQLKDSANNNIGSVNSYLAESTNNLTAPDGTVNIVNTDNDPIQTETVRSGQTKSATIPNVSWTNTDGSPESTPYGDAIVCDAAPILNVDFSVDDTTPDTNQTVTFTDLTVGATQWLWDFGDGNLSTLQNPTHEYKYAGVYTVTLCASDGSINGKESKTNYITVTLQAIPVTTNLRAHYNFNNYNPSTGALADPISGFNLSQGTLANRPTTGSLDGYQTAVMDGNNDNVGNNDAGFSRSTSTLIMLYRRKRNGAANSEILSAAGGSPSGSYLVFQSVPNGQVITQASTPVSVNSSFPVLDKWLIGTFIFDTTNSSIKYTDCPKTVVTTGANTSTGIRFGANSAAGNGAAQMDIAEAFEYSSALSDANVLLMEKYLISKYPSI